jgi:hypothetical protein
MGCSSPLTIISNGMVRSRPVLGSTNPSDGPSGSPVCTTNPSAAVATQCTLNYLISLPLSWFRSLLVFPRFYLAHCLHFLCEPDWGRNILFKSVTKARVQVKAWAQCVCVFFSISFSELAQNCSDVHPA